MKLRNDPDILIVGSGVSGLLAAVGIAKASAQRERALNVTIIEKRSRIGGVMASPVSDLKFTYSFKHSHREGLTGLVGSKVAEQLAFKLRNILHEILPHTATEDGLTIPTHYIPTKIKDKIQNLPRVSIIERPLGCIEYIGTEYGPEIVARIASSLSEKGVRFLTKTSLDRVELASGKILTRISHNSDELISLKPRFLILAMGIGGQMQFFNQLKNLKVTMSGNEVDIGIKVEMPWTSVSDIASNIGCNPKLVFRNSIGNIRTFCFNYRGFVTCYRFHRHLMTVDGYSILARQSSNTPFSLLAGFKPKSETPEASLGLVMRLMKRVIQIGHGQPLLQLFGDLERSTITSASTLRNNKVKPTLKHFAMSKLYNVLPGADSFVDTLHEMDQICPEVAQKSTLIYFPQTAWGPLKLQVSSCMETSVENIFAVGEFCGQTQGIVESAASGLICGTEVGTRLTAA